MFGRAVGSRQQLVWLEGKRKLPVGTGATRGNVGRETERSEVEGSQVERGPRRGVLTVTLVFVLCVLSSGAAWQSTATAQEAKQSGSEPNVSTGRFVDKIFKDAQGEHKYVVFVPAHYTSSKKWPVILFLHGAGERGKDGRKQTTVGLGPFVKARAATFPFFVVFPQCEDQSSHVLGGWLAGSPDAQRALKILAEVEREYSIDRRKEILTGWSMGGYGTWSLAAAFPKRWHAVVPAPGGGDTAWD